MPCYDSLMCAPEAHKTDTSSLYCFIPPLSLFCSLSPHRLTLWPPLRGWVLSACIGLCYKFPFFSVFFTVCVCVYVSVLEQRWILDYTGGTLRCMVLLLPLHITIQPPLWLLIPTNVGRVWEERKAIQSSKCIWETCRAENNVTCWLSVIQNQQHQNWVNTNACSPIQDQT